MGIYGYFTDKDPLWDPPYTDLACERRRTDTSICGVEYKKISAPCGYWEMIKISSPEGALSIGRPEGVYDTLTLDRFDLMDIASIEEASDEVASELCRLCEIDDVLPERVLVVGLGNPELTPDSLGSLSAKRVKATKHIKDIDKRLFTVLECSEISVVTPGVRAFSGMDAHTAIHGICNAISPSLIITVDSLAARSSERLGSTIQICNTGVSPGSGIGNCSIPLTRETLGAPVISIGVPTIIDSRIFSSDCTNQSGEKIGTSRAMFVSPKEICEIVDVGAKIISDGINQAFGLYS